MNKHIKEACKQYITQEVNPEYGIMLTGPWGCGKTFFVNELQKESWLKNTKTKNEKKVVKISLYGVTVKEDIDTQLFYATHEKLDNELIKNAGTIIGTFLGGSYNIDGKTAMSMCFKDWSKEVKVIIADDLERANMPVHEIMGYFYNYIVNQSIRIIFIGNEDEIKDTEGNKDRKFERTKEKVIGETYTLQPQIEDAVQAFLAMEIDIEIPSERAVQICLKVIERLEIINLRTIWQGLVRVQRLMSAIVESKAFNSVTYLPEEYSVNDHTKEDYLAEVLELYLVLYMQITTGEVTIENDTSIDDDALSQSIIEEMIGVYKHDLCSVATLNKREERKKLQTKVGSYQDNTSSILRNMRRIVSGFVALLSSGKDRDKIWSDFLFESKINKELLNNVVSEDKEWFTPKKDVKSNLYKLVSDGINMEDEDFNNCYETVIDEFLRGEYVDVGELMHGYSLCLTYKEFGVREYTEGEISSLFDKILSNTNIKLEARYSSWLVYDRGSMGYQFSSNMQIGEGKAFADKLRDLENNVRKDTDKKIFLDEFEAISSAHELNEWFGILYVNNTGRAYNKYYEEPVLSWLGSDKIFDKLILFPFGEQLDFVDTLKSRYEMRYSNGEFKRKHYSDYNVLVDLDKKYAEYLHSIGIGSIQNYRLSIIARRLKELIVYCKSFMDRANND